MVKRLNVVFIAIVISVMFTACGKSEKVDVTPILDKTVSESNQNEDAIIQEDEWGISLIVKDVTCNGLTLEIIQSGGNPTGELQFGEEFHLEKLTDNQWVKVETLSTGDIAWHDVAYMVSMEGTTEHEVVWKYLFGPLTEGTYRITKPFMDFRSTGDYDMKDYYVEFEIMSDTPLGE